MFCKWDYYGGLSVYEIMYYKWLEQTGLLFSQHYCAHVDVPKYEHGITHFFVSLVNN